MGESSACLVRSLSQPSPTSSDEKQGNPLQRALSTSISFGRFMSESLDWEKWSAFTQNRYLEEVEKYKRPGSVAEKKAYFEARYKRRKAEALLGQDNEVCTDLPRLNETNEDHDDSSSDLESAQKNGNVVTRITKKDEVTVLEGILEDAGNTVKKSSNTLEIERDIGNIMPNKEDNTQEKGATMGYSALSGQKKPAFSPAKLSTTKNSDLSTPNSKKTIRDSINRKRSTPRSLHGSINFDAHAREAIKASSPGPKKILNSRLIPTHSNKSKDSTTAPTSTRASMNSMVKHPATTTPRPENKSYSRPSSTRESKAQPSILPSSFIFKSEERAAKRKEFFQKLEEKKKNAQEPEKQQLQAKSKEKPKIDFRNLRHSIAFKVGPNGKISGKAESPKSLVKKEKPKTDFRDLCHSIAFKVAPNGKASGKTESSNCLGEKEKPKIDFRDSCSTALKLAPDGKMEAPKRLMKKEKPKVDFRDLRHSISYKVADRKISGKTESPNSLLKKVPKGQTCEEELKAKAASKVQVKNSRPAWRFSAKTDGSKDVTPIYSAKSLPKKKRQHENVPPNIQP